MILWKDLLIIGSIPVLITICYVIIIVKKFFDMLGKFRK